MDTSTAPTTPPTSLAVPEIVTGWPVGTVAPAPRARDGRPVGAVVSVDAVAGAQTRHATWRGWTPMSANRFTVACCIRASAGAPAPSCGLVQPHDHWIDPAENTNAPLGARYNVV